MPHNLSDEQWQQIEADLFAGRKIQAIKLFRESTNSGLKEAKDVLDEHERVLREQFPEKFTASKQVGCYVSAMIALTVAAAAAAFVLSH